MFDIGFLEMMVIGVLALLVLGPERLPGAIKSCIQTVRSIKEMANGFKQEVSAQIDAHDLHANLKKAEELGMKNIGKDLQDSVNELKAAAASVQRPYQQSKSEFENNSIGASSADKKETLSVESKVPDHSLPPIAAPTSIQPAPQADFDDYQHNDKQHEAEATHEQSHADNSFDNSLIKENLDVNKTTNQAEKIGTRKKQTVTLKSKNDHE